MTVFTSTDNRRAVALDTDTPPAAIAIGRPWTVAATLPTGESRVWTAVARADARTIRNAYVTNGGQARITR